MKDTICKALFLLIFLFSCSGREKRPILSSPVKSTLPKTAVATTPPMGWNSYDCYGATVTEQEVKDNAMIMSVHLKEFGWEYVVVDYCWYYPYPGAMNNPPQSKDFKPGLRMDENGRLLPALDRFPNSTDNRGFKHLSDYVHGLGLKFGIHIMRGIPREAVAKKLQVMGTSVTADMIADTNSVCNWLNTMYGIDMNKKGAQEYYNSLFELYASWGVDYVKVDDISSPYRYPEIEAVRKAIDNCKRPIVLSLSPGDFIVADQAEHVKRNANLWRISSDFWDNWESLKKQFENCNSWAPYIGKGHWPDADMLPLGRLNRRGPDGGPERETNFTQEEQKTMMSLWCIFRSPLMIGADLIVLDNYTRNLLTRGEVLAVNQNSLNNRQLFRDGDKVAWIADVSGTPDKYLALFNLGDKETTVEANLEEIGIKSGCQIRDLWEEKDLGTFKTKFSQRINPHGSGMFKLTVIL